MQQLLRSLTTSTLLPLAWMEWMLQKHTLFDISKVAQDFWLEFFLNLILYLNALQKIWFLICKKYGGKVKGQQCSVLFSVILFSMISAKEIIFVQSSIMVLVCNMTFIKSRIHIIEWMCCELLYTHVVVLFKIGGVLFSYNMYFIHYWLCAGLGIFPL